MFCLFPRASQLAGSLLAPDWRWSMFLLFPGFALSEVFRAPTAVMVQEAAYASCKTTATASHLCARNLLGGLGPLVASAVGAKYGLQQALLIAPVAYLLSAAAFWYAELLVRREVEGRLVCALCTEDEIDALASGDDDDEDRDKSIVLGKSLKV